MWLSLQRSSMRKPDATITLDLPPQQSDPNARPGSWKAKAFPAKKYAQASGEVVWGYALQLGKPRWRSVIVRLVYVLPRLQKKGSDQRHDPDNLIAWAKKPLDLLTQYEILADDRDVVYLPPVQRRSKPVIDFEHGEPPGLTIEIWQRRDGECPFCGALTHTPCAG